jgi:hypothetical protein
MRRKNIVFILWGISIVLYANETPNETPKKKSAVVYEPYGGDWEIGDHSEHFRTACEHHGYSVTSYIQANPPGTRPPHNFTVTGFGVNILNRADDYGLIWIHSHGSKGWLSIEPLTGASHDRLVDIAIEKIYNDYRYQFNIPVEDILSYIGVGTTSLGAVEISVSGLFIKKWFNTSSLPVNSKPLIYPTSHLF